MQFRTGLHRDFPVGESILVVYSYPRKIVWETSCPWDMIMVYTYTLAHFELQTIPAVSEQRAHILLTYSVGLKALCTVPILPKTPLNVSGSHS